MSVIQAQTSGKELRFVRCDDEGRLTTNLEATIDDVLMKGQTSGGVKTPILCAADGKLEVLSHVQSGVAISTINSGGHLPSGQGVIALGLDNDGSGTARAIATTSTGRQEVVAFGNTNPADPASGVFETLHTDGNGNLNVQLVSTAAVSPANDTNSALTDSPSKSVAVGLRGRSNISSAASEVALKCSSTGVLEVSSSGGGGSAAANTYDSQSLTSHTDSTTLVRGAYVDLTNASNVRFEILFSGTAIERGDAQTDLQFALEYTDDNTNTVCYSGAGSPVFMSGTLDFDGTSTGFSVATISEGDNSDSSASIRGKFVRLIVFNSNNTTNNTAYNVTAKVILSGF